MKKRMFAMMMVLALLTTAGAAPAEEFATERENAIAAVQRSLPDATIDYAVRERDDGRYEWNVFLTSGGQLGLCKVNESDNEVRRLELFTPPAGALNAAEAMNKLEEAKGAVTITDLELDWDDGCLRYEGEADLDGRRYEFEMLATGEIIEWERD